MKNETNGNRSKGGEEIRALIVDDEAATRAIIRRFGEWERLGIRAVAEAEDGEGALRKIADEEAGIRLVITDMNMPGLDGVGLMKTLNERYPKIKVIVVSGYDDFAYLKQAIRYRANDYLLKPVDPEELNRTLEKCRTDLLEMDALEQEAFAPDDETRQLLRGLEPLLVAYYGELRAPELRRALEDLAAERSAREDAAASNRRIARELHELLRELRAAHGQEEPIAADSFSGDAGVPELEGLADLYAESLDELIRRRKFRDRLDLNEVRAYVAEHFADPLSLDSLARCFFVSKEYLSRAFRQEFGQTLTDYVQQVRMDKARQWILDGVPIRRASEMCGYEDLGYFYRVFKKQYGIAPGELTRGSI
ncbi:DNA-binding response regulator [Saccharibacillus sp. O23]|uniref:response regulator n=1 Tax=Saccharibacillus sp. O23 TaxID=2009338 RepID=UPI000B4E1D6A|nr:response regulator [Saccharibacillus sp. O23]OWR26669.1 DNA-binding response regulator [Saccharibacillus sp. O23]